MLELDDRPPVDGRKLHKDIAAGYALPTAWYADRAVFREEMKRILRRSWHFAAHAGDLPAPGDVFIRDLAGAPIMLVRQRDGSVKGFLNICRHRGHPVVLENGSRNALRCHYHGWTYELDGALRHAPRAEGDAAFDVRCFGLTPIQTHQWGALIWANLDLEAPAFEAWIEGMPALVKQCGLNLERHVYAFDHTWRIDANWKVFQDNTIECYHCPTAHPELARALEMRPEKQTYFVGARYWIHHRIPFRDEAASAPTFRRREGKPLVYYYQWIFPTTYLQFVTDDSFDIGAIDVIDVDRIDFRHITFMPPGTAPETIEQGRARLASDPTIHQDVDICRRVQHAHASGLAPTARLLVEPERLLTHFQHLIVEMMSGVPRASA